MDQDRSYISNIIEALNVKRNSIHVGNRHCNFEEVNIIYEKMIVVKLIHQVNEQ